MTNLPCKCFSTVQVKYTLYTVSDFHQLMKCNDNQLLQISRSFTRLALLLSCEKEIKKSKTITSNESTLQYSVKRRIVKPR